MTENEEVVEADILNNEPKDLVWLIGYMRDLIAKEIESEIEDILEKEPKSKKTNANLISKIEGLRRAADIARER
jgi:hypothetical protein